MNAAKANPLTAAIAELPRVQLASIRPTPLEPLPRLTACLDSPALYIKRDDLNGLAFGGNKTRMFEFALADALAKGADTIVSGAAVQSNYCRQLAAACAKLDLELHLILRPVVRNRPHRIAREQPVTAPARCTNHRPSGKRPAWPTRRSASQGGGAFRAGEKSVLAAPRRYG